MADKVEISDEQLRQIAERHLPAEYIQPNGGVMAALREVVAELMQPAAFPKTREELVKDQGPRVDTRPFPPAPQAGSGEPPTTTDEPLGTCAGFCEYYKVPHRKRLCSGDNWKPLLSTPAPQAQEGMEHLWAYLRSLNRDLDISDGVYFQMYESYELAKAKMKGSAWNPDKLRARLTTTEIEAYARARVEQETEELRNFFKS